MEGKKQGTSGIFGSQRLHRIGLVVGLIGALLLQAGCRSTPEAEPSVATAPAEPKSPSQDRATPAETSSTPMQGEPAPEKPTPRITFTELVHDFGEISPSSRHMCEFHFKNTGTATLCLEPKIDSTCGCTVPTLSRVNYGPGQSGVIKVTYSAPSAVSLIHKSITVHCNDPEQAQVKLEIKAKIVQRVVCDPLRLELRLKKANGGCPPITLRSQDGEPFSITKITCSGDAITAAFDPNVRARTFTLKPTVDMEKLQKRMMGYLLVDVTHPECKQVRILYNTLREYQFKPAFVTAFNAEPNEPMIKEVQLVNNYGEDFAIASVSSQRQIVKLVSQEKQSPPDSQVPGYRLKLSLTPPAKLRRGRMFVDVLTVRLTNGKELRLNCRGVYLRQGVGSRVGTTPLRTR